MKNEESIVEELKAIAPVFATLRQLEVYTVPNGYFEHLAGEITARINKESLFSQPQSNIFKIPEKYFETLPDAILSKVKFQQSDVVSELDQIAPSLNAISRKDVYQVPSGYFENFSVDQAKRKTATIISFSSTRKWISYAAAAVIAGVLLTGGFLYEMQRTSLDVSKELNKVSDKELNSYVDNSGVELNEENNTLDKDIYIKQNLKVVSDEDLQQYLKDSE